MEVRTVKMGSTEETPLDLIIRKVNWRLYMSTFDPLAHKLRKPTPEEVERSQKYDVLHDQFKLEDETLRQIEKNLNRLRSLSYFEARSVLDAYRVIKKQNADMRKALESANERNTALDSKVRILQGRIELYEMSKIRSLIKKIVMTLLRWDDSIQKVKQHDKGE